MMTGRRPGDTDWH